MTLQELKKWGREEQARQIAEYGVPLSVFPEEFAEKVWNAAIDACVEAMPEEIDKRSGKTQGSRAGIGMWNGYRKLTLSALSKLKNL